MPKDILLEDRLGLNKKEIDRNTDTGQTLFDFDPEEFEELHQPLPSGVLHVPRKQNALKTLEHPATFIALYLTLTLGFVKWYGYILAFAISMIRLWFINTYNLELSKQKGQQATVG